MDTSMYNEQTILDILDRFECDKKEFSKHRVEYQELVTQTKGDAKIQQAYLRLVLNRDDNREFTDEELSFLLGDDWKSRVEKFEKRRHQQFKILDREGYSCDLSNLPQDKHISTRFNILDQDKDIRVIDEADQNTVKIPSNVCVAISLTVPACRQGRGAVLWQPKENDSDRSSRHWARVPDLLYLDMVWLNHEREAFLKASYRRQRDFLCASLRLRSTDVVLPIALDFDGSARENHQSASVRTDAHGRPTAKAAISIPGAGFVAWGFKWTSRAHGPESDESDETDNLDARPVNEVVHEWWKNKKDRNAAKVANLTAMLQKIQQMYNNPITDALVFYQHVLNCIEAASDSS